jgi:hypothetical protein
MITAAAVLKGPAFVQLPCGGSISILIVLDRVERSFLYNVDTNTMTSDGWCGVIREEQRYEVGICLPIL